MPSTIHKDKSIRFFEILPGALTWTTLIAAPILSYYHPVWIAIYIILFDTYWFLKAGNVAIHLFHSYARLKIHERISWPDWLNRLGKPGFVNYLESLIKQEKNRRLRSLYKEELARLKKLPANHNLDWSRIHHLIVLPTYKEDISVLEASIDSYVATGYPKEKMILALALEERAGLEARDIATSISEKYKDSFLFVLTTFHPHGLEGEVVGKAGNMNFACRKARIEFDQRNIPYEDVIISAFDADTITSESYFAHLTYDFLTEVKPLQNSYQPMPVYHNNIWDTPAIARVIAISSSFWQLVEASRPDRLITFSSHSMSFKTLVDVGFFKADSINEDSLIFWQCFVHFNGEYRNRPLFTIVSMDAVMGNNYWETMVAQYKQKRRWAYGVTQIGYVFQNVLGNKAIPWWKRFIYSERILEGHYFWATASIIIAILGWLPLILGGDRFGDTVLAYNLPFMTRVIMTTASVFLILSMYISMVRLPPRPPGYSRWKTVSMLLQWFLSPIVSSVWGSAPAIDAQTRLMLGKYMEEFWVTPKIRKAENKQSAINSIVNL